MILKRANELIYFLFISLFDSYATKAMTYCLLNDQRVQLLKKVSQLIFSICASFRIVIHGDSQETNCLKHHFFVKTLVLL